MFRQRVWLNRGLGLGVWVLALFTLILVPLESAMVRITLPSYWESTPLLQSLEIQGTQPETAVALLRRTGQ